MAPSQDGPQREDIPLLIPPFTDTRNLKTKKGAQVRNYNDMVLIDILGAPDVKLRRPQAFLDT